MRVRAAISEIWRETSRAAGSAPLRRGPVALSGLLAATLVTILTSSACIVICEVNEHAEFGTCVCDSGYSRDDRGECAPDSFSTVQRWYLTDACNDSRDIEWRLFSSDSDVVWDQPDGYPFVTWGLFERSYEDIECLVGEEICFGAIAGDNAWGCDIDTGANCIPEEDCFYCEEFVDIDLEDLVCY